MAALKAIRLAYLVSAAVVAELALLGHTSADETSDYIQKHIRLHVYTNETALLTEGHQIRDHLDKRSILQAKFKPGLPTKVFVHGFDNNVLSPSVQITKNAYFAAKAQVNVIAVDWSDLIDTLLYTVSLYNARYAGAHLAAFLDLLDAEGLAPLDSVHVIGHSLGAHVAAIAGEHVERGKLGRITGLDPAGPLVDLATPEGRLSPDDARLVDVVHTNAGLLGEKQAVGHVDFYPNNGASQPGCILDLTGSCSHGRAYELWAESVRNPQAFDYAVLCGSSEEAMTTSCSSSKTTATMGESCKFTHKGSYFLKTRSSSPFSQAKKQ